MFNELRSPYRTLHPMDRIDRLQFDIKDQQTGLYMPAEPLDDGISYTLIALASEIQIGGLSFLTETVQFHFAHSAIHSPMGMNLRNLVISGLVPILGIAIEQSRRVDSETDRDQIVVSPMRLSTHFRHIPNDDGTITTERL
jgi:hypothetical protein